MAIFKAVRQGEFVATNGNTVRIGFDASGNLRINARKGDHNQSVSVIDAATVAAVIAFVTGADNV